MEPGVLRHRWWQILLATVVGAAAATGWLYTRDPVWEATTSVLVYPDGRDINVVGGRTQGQVNLDTEAQLVRSTAVAAGTAARLERDPVPDDLARQVRVEVPPNTSVLMITFAADTPAQAQAGSRAFAEAYLHHREEAAQAAMTGQVTAIGAKVDELDRRLTEINQRVAEAPPGSATAANLESQRAAVANQLLSLSDRVNELTTATVTAGSVISEARLPSEPSRPQPLIVLASGAALGLVAGLGAAGLLERLARRVRRPADLSHRLGIPVLASLTATTALSSDEIASPYRPAGRVVDRLRTEVLAAQRGAGPGEPAGAGKVIVVTSPGGGAATGLVAVNLAASLARCGHDVTLVAAGGKPEAEAGPIAALLGVAAAPGLSEVLAGRASITEALQRPPRQPRLRVMTVGATATAAGLLQSPALSTVLASVAGQTGYVVVAAPGTASSADAQSLASHARAALLVVEQRRTRLADAADAAVQLHRVGTPLLGAVLVPSPPRRLADVDSSEPPPAADVETDPQTLVMPRLGEDGLDAGDQGGAGTGGKAAPSPKKTREPSDAR